MQLNETFEIIHEILTSQGKDTNYIVLVNNIGDPSIKFFNVVSIKLSFGKTNYIYMKSSTKAYFSDSSLYEELKSLPNWIRSPISNKDDLINLSSIIISIYDSITAADPFGCCSSYLECSDEKKCIRTDLRAKACIYRKNLESGKIFYGKNRNI